MARRIVWSKKAETVFIKILEYYNHRNESNVYSRKLNSEIKKHLELLSNHPWIGLKTENKNTRVLIKHHFKIFYRIEPETIVILLIWDSRQNPENLNL